MMSIPNGGTRHKGEMKKLLATGLLAGASDLMVNHLGKWICIECKGAKGVQSPAQLRFERIVTKLNTPYHVVRSLDEFKAIIDFYNTKLAKQD